ncbi:hypothetical protein UY3_14382 [Chelonia mydas]|uniref:Uncharacterized protein n=1 Tax=Chelonia mydas TaxID=8469 RepID=M7AZF1_CHEMY|nr:hypothetical protein UY3_14382 [Chelonia mydas]
MAPGRAHPALVSAWLLFLCSVVSAGVHHFTHSQIISPQAGPGLPKCQSLLQVNGLALSAYDSSSQRMTPRNGYVQGDQETHQFWSVSSARCMFWDPWVETEYQALPCDIEVTWERGVRGALGEQMTSGIQPNGGPTFQIQVSIELGLGEHMCMVRHISLGGTPLRISWARCLLQSPPTPPLPSVLP